MYSSPIYRTNMQLKVLLLNERSKLPTRSEEGAAGYDLYASESVFIPVGQTRVVPTGIAIQLPVIEAFPYQPTLTYFKIEDRSGLASRGLRTGAGIVDSSYTGEVKVVIHNINNSSNEFGYMVNVGDRIAQGIIQTALIPQVVETKELSKTTRGAAGFGSSGK